MNILISAIVPVYNSEKFLKDCIKSLRNQSLKEIEMIFVNDGSSDRSLDILRKYKNIDSRIKIINQENSGPSIARNRGLEIAKGEYISFIDSDDWIDKDMYKEMYNLAKSKESDAVICDMKMVNNKNELYVKGLDYNLNTYSKKDIEEKIFKELLSNSQFNSMANKIFKSQIINKNNIRLDPDIYYAEDWLFNMKFFKECNKISYINKCFYYYRRGHESSSSSYKDDTFERVGLWIYRKRKEYARILGLSEDLGCEELYKVIIHCIISEFRREDISFSEKKSRVKNIISKIETKEVIECVRNHSISIKDKYILNCIKYNLIIALFGYVFMGKMKCNMINK